MMNENYNTPNSGCCGRPFPTAPENKCNYNDCCMNEYAYKQKACIREKQPDCEAQAVIPSITVETIDGITNLANCLVHVTSTNTTYYVDDKHRIMITWAGPVNIPGYNMETNPNHYKNQIVTDTDAKIAVIYDNNGRGFTFGIEKDADFTEAVSIATADKLEQMAVDGEFNPILNSLFMSYYNELQRYTDSQLGNKVDKDGSGQVTYNNLSQSVKEMFTGGNTAVVGVNSVADSNIIDNSISYQKLNDNGRKGVAGYPQDKTLNFSWEQGKRDTSVDGSLVNDSKIITCTAPFTFSLGMKITTATGYKAHIYSWTGGTKTNFNSSYGALSHVIGTTTPDQDHEWYISISRTDSANITPAEGVDSIFVIEHQSNVSPSYVATDTSVQKLLSGKSTTIKVIDSTNFGNAIQSNPDFGYYKGNYTTSNFTRAWLNTPIFLPAGANIQVTNSWKFIIIKASSRMNTTKSYYPSTWGSELTVPEDDVYYFAYKKSDDSDIGTTSASDFTNYLSIFIPAASSLEKISYVSGVGNDSTGDGSAENPYRQIAKALSVGAKTIICSPNYRYDDLRLSNLSNVKIVGAMPQYSLDNQKQLKPYFDNSIELDDGTLENGKIKITYTAEAGSDMYECLVAKTKDIDDGVTRTYGYYCTIYSEGDKDTSHRYIPVLTQDDVEGHFFYDGQYIYINPYTDNSETTKYLLVDKAEQSQLSLVSLNNCHNITFENFIFKHSSSSLLITNACTGIKVNNCEFCGSSMSDNLHAVDTDIDVEESVSYLARNDGFNFHGFGNSIVTKCVGCNCFDDGISHHDQCTHTIIGGEYYNNGKGGVASPTYGCSGDIIGVYTHDNSYGIYTVTDNSHGTSYINLNNSLITGNTTGVKLSGCAGVMYNNKVVDNATNINNTSSVVIYQ